MAPLRSCITAASCTSLSSLSPCIYRFYLNSGLYLYYRSTDYKGPLNLDDSDHLENIRTWVLFGNAQKSAQLRHKLQYQLNLQPTIAYAPLPASAKWPYLPSWSPISQSFPPNVHLLSLLQYNNTLNDTLLLRLVHIFEKGEDPVLSLPVTLDLDKYLSFASIVEMEERSLTATLPISAVKNRWTWSTTQQKQQDSRPNSMPSSSSPSNKEGSQVVTLNPAEIKTFFVTLK